MQTPIKPRPGAAGYLFGAALVVVAAGVLTVTIFSFVGALSEFDRSLQRVVLPGKDVVELSQAGTYTVYLESQPGTPTSTQGLTWDVVDLESGQPIATDRVFGSETYNFGNRHGQAIARFTVTTPTSAEISGSYGTGSPGPQLTLAFGQNLVGSIMSGVFIMMFGIGGAVILFVIGVILIVVTVVRRHSWDTAQKNATGSATFA